MADSEGEGILGIEVGPSVRCALYRLGLGCTCALMRSGVKGILWEFFVELQLGPLEMTLEITRWDKAYWKGLGL